MVKLDIFWKTFFFSFLIVTLIIYDQQKPTTLLYLVFWLEVILFWNQDEIMQLVNTQRKSAILFFNMLLKLIDWIHHCKNPVLSSHSHLIFYRAQIGSVFSTLWCYSCNYSDKISSTFLPLKYLWYFIMNKSRSYQIHVLVFAFTLIDTCHEHPGNYVSCRSEIVKISLNTTVLDKN